MSNIKISLTIILPGRVFMSEEVCQSDFNNNYKHFNINVSYPIWHKKTNSKETINTTLHIHTRKTYPCKQVINLYEEFYEDAVSADAPIGFPSKASWKSMSKKQRLEYHLKQIVTDRGGIDFTYSIID